MGSPDVAGPAPVDNRQPARPTIRALRSRPLRRYLVGQLPSVTCSWAQVVALSWVVMERDPRALGWVVAVQFLPTLALGPWFGALTDRHDRRRLLMLTEVWLGLVALGYATLSALHHLTLPWICVLATAWGVVNALDTPARRALLPMLVPAGAASAASALAGTVMLVGMSAGSALGATLVATMGVTVAFAVNSASFLADVAILATIRVAASPQVKRGPGQVRDGIAYVRSHPPLRDALLALAVVATFAFPVQVSVPLVIRTSLNGGPSQVGAGLTSVAVGSLAGALTAAARGVPARLSRACLLLGAASAVTALAPGVLAAYVSLSGVGFAWSWLLMSVIGTLQTAEPRMMGRVMSLLAVVLLGGNTIGGPLAAAAAGVAGSRAPFVLGSLAAGAVALATTRHQSPALRSASRAPADELPA